MSDIAMSVTCNIDGVYKSFLLENIQDTPINESSTITVHPVPSGEFISDSMFKNPTTMTVSGSFGNSGKKGLVINGEGELTLENIQAFFRKIKNGGILCDLVKVKTQENNTPCFSIWRGMALRNISWTEKINSLDFSFDFQQVMQVEIQDPQIDQSDENLPDIGEPKTLNFTESLFDPNKVVELLMQGLIDKKLITKKFLNYLGGLGKSSLIALGIGALLAGLFISGIGIVGALLVGAIVAFGYFLYKLIKKATEMSKKVKVFDYHKSKKKNEEEVKRLASLQEEVLKSCEILNRSIAVYQISENKAQQCILSIDDNYYCFTFTRNNTDNSYGLTILDLDGKIVKDSKSTPNVKNGALKSLDDCTSQTAIISTNSGYQVFLLNPSENRTDDLTECYIMVSSMNMDKYVNMLSELIVNYIVY